MSRDEVRASHQRQALHQQLHAHFDRWLDELEAQLSEAESTLTQVSETIWGLHQQLTGDVALEHVDVLRHGDRIGRVARVHMHGQGLPLRRDPQPHHDWCLARLLVLVLPKGRPFILLPIQGGEVTSYKTTLGGPPRCRTVR